MKTTIADFDHCLSIEEHLVSIGLDLDDDQTETLEAFCLLVHQSSNRITYCEKRSENLYCVFKSAWLTRLTAMISKDVDVSTRCLNNCKDAA